MAAGIASALLLTLVSYVLVDNVGLLTGASSTVNVLLVSVVPATMVAGGVVAVWLRNRRPATYARVGEGDADEGETRPASAGVVSP